MVEDNTYSKNTEDDCNSDNGIREKEIQIKINKTKSSEEEANCKYLSLNITY